MIKNILFHFIVLYILFPLQSKGQEMWGISNSNFAGNMGIFLNPSGIVMAPYVSEVHFLSGDFFVDNNYVFVKKRSRLFSRTISGEGIPDDRFGDFYLQPSLKRGYASSHIMGPAYIKNNGTSAWGVHIAMRNVLSATGYPFHVSKFIYDGLDFVPQQNIEYSSTPFKTSAAGWYELGGTYARVLLSTDFEKHVIKAGATLNVMAGNYGMYVKTESGNYTVPSNDLLIINNLNAEYGHAAPLENSSAGRYLFKIRGWGASTTLGATYINSLNRGGYDCNKTADKLKKYKYRIGFSLIDFGMIKFSNKETRKFNFDNASVYWPGVDTTQFISWNHIDSLLSEKFYSNPLRSQSGDAFTVFLPSAVSLQFDYNIKPKYYLNATLINRLAFSSYSVRRASQIALSARYETRKFEATIPLSLYEYRTLHLGAAVRYGIFVAGTDRLASLLGFWDTTGLDFFFGIKWQGCGKNNRGKNDTGCPF